MAVPKFITNDMKGGYVGGPTTPVRRGYVGSGLVYQGFSPASEQEFIQQTAAGGPAEVLKCYGKSVVWNQKMDTPHLVATSTNSWQTIPSTLFPVTTSHKYALTLSNTVHLGVRVRYPYISGLITTSTILTPSTDGNMGLQFVGPSGNVGAVDAYICVFDLTLMYGAGNEPANIAQFLADHPDALTASFDPGSLQSNKTAELRAERIPVINVWDEEWENKEFNDSTHDWFDSPTRLASKNLIPVFPSTNYYFKNPAGTVSRWVFYDANGNYLSYVSASSNSTFTTPADARYMKFGMGGNYGSTYSHDICINLSDPAINGQYFPHWRGSLSLNLSTLTGKLNGEGASVVVFPDGLRGVGTDRDAAYGSTGEVARAVVDLGTLNWSYVSGFFYATGIPAAKTLTDTLICPGYVNAEVSSSTTTDKAMKIYGGSPVLRVKDSAYTDAPTFKTAMSGVMLEYPLATPLTYTLDTPLPTDLTCVQGDILQRVSDNNCPFVGEMKFGL